MEFYTASLLFTGLEHEKFEVIMIHIYHEELLINFLVFPQRVSLDHLNLQLCSYELCTEAFAAFRSRQLQAPRVLMIDPTRSQIDLQVAGGVGDEEEEEEGKFRSSVLQDLHMVRQPSLLCTRYTSTVFLFTYYCTNSPTQLGVEKNGLYLDEDTYTKLIAVDVVEFQCMALTQ